jgi:3-hydroxyacyl-[acyl-carrier-protein] dehydratase
MPINAAEIQSKLDCQPSLMLLDQVVVLDKDKQIIAQKSVSANEIYFQGHFPNNPVMPGVLLIESMVEAAKLMWDEPDLVLTQVKRGRFREMVKPGMQLTIKVIAMEKYSCQAEVLIAEKKACTADLSFRTE